MKLLGWILHGGERTGKDLTLLAFEMLVLHVTEKEKERRKDTSMKLWQP